MNMSRYAILLEFMFIVSLLVITTSGESSNNYLVGIWDNFNFSRPAADWSGAARGFGAENAMVDLVVAQWNDDGFTDLPFPLQSSGYLRGISDIDLAEPYLQEFDRDGQKVILSIQPGHADLPRLMEILLTRYGHHQNIIGVNVDLEWKKTGKANYTSNDERDIWLNTIKKYNPKLKLFLTYFMDHTHFPDDTKDLVILFDGETDTQSNILKEYKKLASHFESVGIYTGYPSNLPQTVSSNRVLSAVPKTKYIIHTYDVFPFEKSLIFLMSDVQVDWLESTSIDLLDLQQRKNVPVVVGVIADNLDNSESDLRDRLLDLHENSSDLFELAEYAYLDNTSLSYSDQNKSIASEFKIFSKLGIKPATLLPSLLVADETTVKVAGDLGFSSLITSSQNLHSSKLKILNSLIFLTKTDAKISILKSPQELMTEIDSGKQNVSIIFYEIQDFAPDSGNNVQELGSIMDALKQSKKYRFMTIGQYLETLPSANQVWANSMQQPGLNIFMGAITLFAVWRYLSL
jgi:hypothetical protein